MNRSWRLSLVDNMTTRVTSAKKYTDIWSNLLRQLNSKCIRNRCAFLANHFFVKTEIEWPTFHSFANFLSSLFCSSFRPKGETKTTFTAPSEAKSLIFSSAACLSLRSVLASAELSTTCWIPNDRRPPCSIRRDLSLISLIGLAPAAHSIKVCREFVWTAKYIAVFPSQFRQLTTSLCSPLAAFLPGCHNLLLCQKSLIGAGSSCG